MNQRFTPSICNSIVDISADDWDCLTNPSDQPYDPFLSYAFFHALEKSGSATEETGWAPHHLLIKDEKGMLVGLLPLYLKGHSQGEYVFDHGWADGYTAAGLQYYPKLLCAVPFTPVTGRRLFSKKQDAPLLQNGLITAGVNLLERYQLSSFHINFIQEDMGPPLEDRGFLLRADTQFHWQNNCYCTFDDFLSELTSRKRKTIKRERQQALENDIEIEWVQGSEIQPHHWDAIFAFYQDTGSRKWGMPYLTRSFFDEIGQTLSDSIVLILAKREGKYIAGALNFIGSDTLYGRYWGAIEHHNFLHFEICYYQAIDFALANNLDRVEAGAQGEHKLARGYRPTSTYSAHFIAHDAFRQAIKNFLIDEGCFKTMRDKALSAHLPFRGDEKNDL